MRANVHGNWIIDYWLAVFEDSLKRLASGLINTQLSEPCCCSWKYLGCHLILLSLRCLASSRCFCSIFCLAIVALSICLVFKWNVTSFQSLEIKTQTSQKQNKKSQVSNPTKQRDLLDSNSSCSLIGRTCFLTIVDCISLGFMNWSVCSKQKTKTKIYNNLWYIHNWPPICVWSTLEAYVSWITFLDDFK